VGDRKARRGLWGFWPTLDDTRSIRYKIIATISGRTHSVVSDFPCSLMAVDTDCLARAHQALIFDERVANSQLSY
jgi:hypothetical protein